jgi:predicted DNA-binding transcriptional regulator AlpA
VSDNSSLNGRNHTCTKSIMAIDESGLRAPDRGRAQRVSLSKWVNESLPSFQELLTSHEVARLTRRHRWVLAALTVAGCFPLKQRFHGRSIGWRRNDVERWLAERSATEHRNHSRPANIGFTRSPQRDQRYCPIAAAKMRRVGCRSSLQHAARASHQKVVRP